jgi:hypothetical protein
MGAGAGNEFARWELKRPFRRKRLGEVRSRSNCRIVPQAIRVAAKRGLNLAAGIASLTLTAAS